MGDQLRMMKLSKYARNETEFLIAKTKMDQLDIDFKNLSVTAGQLKKEIDSLYRIYYTVDSLTPLGYQAVCYYKFFSPGKSVHSDTTYLYLNKNMEVIWRQDLYKMRSLKL